MVVPIVLRRLVVEVAGKPVPLESRTSEAEGEEDMPVELE